MRRCEEHGKVIALKKQIHTALRAYTGRGHVALAHIEHVPATAPVPAGLGGTWRTSCWTRSLMPPMTMLCGAHGEVPLQAPDAVAVLPKVQAHMSPVSAPPLENHPVASGSVTDSASSCARMDAMALLCHDHAFGLRPRPLVECSTSHDDGHALGSPIKEKAMAPNKITTKNN